MSALAESKQKHISQLCFESQIRQCFNESAELIFVDGMSQWTDTK